MAISTTLGNEVLDAIFNAGAYSVANPYVSLHTADPGATGASECTGGTGPYARKLGSFATAATKATTTDAALTWTGMPACTVTHVGLWDAVTSGNFLMGAALSANKTLDAGDTFQFNTGDLDASAS